jgi:hypothetical protein
MDFILGAPATLEMVELKYVLEAKIPSVNVQQLFHSSHSTATPADFVDHLWHGPLGCLATILIKSGITLWLQSLQACGTSLPYSDYWDMGFNLIG